MAPRTPTPEDLSVLPTRGELSYQLPNVTWPDGSRVAITIRALSARERAAVERAAVAAGGQHKIEYDDMTALVETVYHGIAQPRLEDSHKAILWGWNVWILEQIADQITALGRLPARDLQTHLERLAGIAVPEPTAAAAGKARKRRADQPGGAAGNPARAAAEPGA